MIDDRILNLLRCPQTRYRLRLAEPELCDRLNRAIEQGQLVNRLGRLVTEPLDGGLVNEDDRVFYPICQGIPQLLVDEMIPLDQLEKWPKEAEQP